MERFLDEFWSQLSLRNKTHSSTCTKWHHLGSHCSSWGITFHSDLPFHMCWTTIRWNVVRFCGISYHMYFDFDFDIELFRLNSQGKASVSINSLVVWDTCLRGTVFFGTAKHLLLCTSCGYVGYLAMWDSWDGPLSHLSRFDCITLVAVSSVCGCRIMPTCAIAAWKFGFSWCFLSYTTYSEDENCSFETLAPRLDCCHADKNDCVKHVWKQAKCRHRTLTLDAVKNAGTAPLDAGKMLAPHLWT